MKMILVFIHAHELYAFKLLLENPHVTVVF